MNKLCALTSILFLSIALMGCSKSSQSGTAGDLTKVSAPKASVKATGSKEPPVVETPKLPSPPGEKLSPEEQQLLDLINTARSKASAPPLRWNTKLAAVARARATEMGTDKGGRANINDKTLAKDLNEAGYPFSTCFQMAGMEASPKAMLVKWMADPQSRSFLMNPDCDEMGLGVSRAPGKTFASFCQVMAKQQKTPAPNQS